MPLNGLQGVLAKGGGEEKHKEKMKIREKEREKMKIKEREREIIGMRD